MDPDGGVTRALTTRYAQMFPAEAAALLDTCPSDEVATLMAAVPPDTAASLLQRARAERVADVLDRLPDAAFPAVVSSLDPALVAAGLMRLDEGRRGKRLALLKPAAAGELVALIQYPPDSAGGMMDPRITTFRPESVVSDVVDRLRTTKVRGRIADVFLVDGDGQLAGAVALQDLVAADPATRLAELSQNAVSVPDTAPQAEVVELLERTRAASVPVVDFNGRVIGVIRQAALLAATQQEATADIQRMVGVSTDERALSSAWFAVRKRLPWLQINLLTAFLAAAVVGLFESTIAQFTALAVLLPVVAGQSGNTGAQALAVTMRGLALREVWGRHWPRIALKEVAAGAVNGLAVAAVTGAAVLVWSRSPGLAGVIVISMVVSMTIAGLAGASIPILLARLGQDPASAASIILTTVTDVFGFFSFLGLATLGASFL